MTEFSKGEIGPDGQLKVVRLGTISQADLQKCPHCIFDYHHYREDGSCKCNDPNETIMKTWGYKWKDGQWR